ncbi:MAG: alpha-N-acetylglucosaminidase [Bacteroides sp.]|nr:alpha-N-acetylglucosaminidase [Bacteroides sp.]
MKRLKQLVCALVSGIMFSGCGNDAASQAEKVIERTFGKMPGNVRIVVNGSPDSTDTYTLSVSGGVLTVSGNSTVSVCKGFHDYILENGYGVATWTGNRLELPEELPDMEIVRKVSPFKGHLYQNVCTFGYTSPFWGWKEWEREIDWMALHGFDMPLAPIAGEAILARVWKEIGLSQEEIDAYFTGPAHFPWMRMGNMTAVDGGMSQEWHRQQIELQHRINDRMLALGMTPVYQGFAGFVPKAVKEHWPEVDMMTTKWSGHESYMLSPVDSLFSVIGTAFIREWEKEFGKGKYYLIDSFNELDIPFGEKGSKERHDKLKYYGETIYRTLADANPDAVWVMQGWMFGYQRDIWDPESVEALLSGAPDDRLMIIDLAVDFNNYVWKNGNSWDNLNGFYGKPWIWSTVPNFGGRTALKGPLDFYLNGHLEALKSASMGRLTGFGTSPEGVESNEILYELISAAGWSSEEIDIEAFLDSYSKARYGCPDEAFTEFWSELRQSVYCNFTNNARFLWQQRPAYHRGETMNINEHYFNGIESFMSVADKYSDNELYVADAVQYAALYAAAKADYVLKAANWAIVAGDMEKAAALKDLLVMMLRDIDRLLESHPVLRLQRWLDMSAAMATSHQEEEQFAKEVKRLVSTWSGPNLKDYSARVWSGLIRDYYIPRMDLYFTEAIRGGYADLISLDNSFHYGTGYGTPVDWCPEGESLLSDAQPFADPLAAACEMVDRYSAIVYGEREASIPDGKGGRIQTWNIYAPDSEVGFWCPQDFEGKARKRLYMTIMADDYADIDGLEFSNMRGEHVNIAKVEFKSGPNWLGTEIVKSVAPGADGRLRVPHKGPGSTAGMEREVAVYVTLEGGPQSWGMISLY